MVVVLVSSVLSIAFFGVPLLGAPNTVKWLLFFFPMLGIVFATPVLPFLIFSLLDAPLVVRTVGIVFSVAVFLSALFFGLSIPGLADAEILGDFLGATPAAVLAVAGPFVLLRYFLGWQIVIRAWNLPPRRQSVSIGGLMILTVVVAISLAGLRFTRWPANSAAVCAAMSGAVFVFVCPFAYSILRSRRYWVSLTIFSLSMFLLGLMVCSVLIGVELISFTPTMLLQLSVLLTAGCVWLGLGLIAVRLIGGELILHREFETREMES